MAKKPTKGQLKKKLWKVFSQYIRQRDNNICITCGRKGEGSGIHAGHFIPKSVGGLALYFHEKNVHAQCFACNIHKGGWGERYAEVLELKYGREEVDKMRSKRHSIEKWSIQDYEEKIAHYKSLLSD